MTCLESLESLHSKTDAFLRSLSYFCFRLIHLAIFHLFKKICFLKQELRFAVPMEGYIQNRSAGVSDHRNILAV